MTERIETTATNDGVERSKRPRRRKNRRHTDDGSITVSCCCCDNITNPTLPLPTHRRIKAQVDFRLLPLPVIWKKRNARTAHKIRSPIAPVTLGVALKRIICYECRIIQCTVGGRR